MAARTALYGKPDKADPHAFLRWLLLLYFVLEYIRPPGIVNFNLQLIIAVVMLFAFFTAKDRPWSNLFSAQVLLLFVVAKAGLYATNTFNVFEEIKSIICSVIIGFATAWLSSSLVSFRQIMMAWILVLVYSSIYCITHGGRGPGGFMGDENDMAMAASTGLPFALFGFEHFTGVKRWMCLVFGIIFVAAIVATMSRGGFLGFLSVGFYYLLSSSNKLKKLAIVSVAALAFLAFVPSTYLVEMGTIQADIEQEDKADSTAQQRLFLWATAWEMCKANPILGVGSGNFPWHVGSYQPQTGNWPREFFLRDRTMQAVHSVYFQVLAEQGIPGAVLFLYLIWTHFRTLCALRRTSSARSNLPDNSVREIEVYSCSLIGGMIGYLACAVFVATFSYPYFWYLLNAGVGLAIAVRHELGKAGDPLTNASPALPRGREGHLGQRRSY